jgi:hypothetical protein
MARRTAPFGPHDDLWLAAASQLRLAATSPSEIGQRQYLLEALSIAIDAVGEEAIDRFVDREWLGRHSFVEALVVLVERLIEAGAVYLAGVILDDLALPAARLNALENGRRLALCARVAWKSGAIDLARERYEHLAQIGAEFDEPELVVRSTIGLTALAQLRGNLPAVKELATRAASEAHAIGHTELERYAYVGLTMVEAKAGDYAAALHAGWKAVELSAGDTTRETEGLGNLGQVLLEAGQAEVARSCFVAIAARPIPPRFMLVTLGSLARASAEVGNEATVEWSVREIWRARDMNVPRYELAEGLLECAVALYRVARPADAERYRQAARDVADESGFHELVFKAESLEPKAPAPRPAPVPLAELNVVASAVRAMEPGRLPDHVSFEPAPA